MLGACVLVVVRGGHPNFEIGISLPNHVLIPPRCPSQAKYWTVYNLSSIDSYDVNA